MSHKQSNIEIRREDMKSLRGVNWLNDEIMNIYVNLLQVGHSIAVKGAGPSNVSASRRPSAWKRNARVLT